MMVEREVSSVYCLPNVCQTFVDIIWIKEGNILWTLLYRVT